MFGFINKTFSARIGLVWDGKQINLKYTADQSESQDWFSMCKQTKVVYKDVDISVYNEVYHINMPIVTQGTVVTQELRSYITELAKQGNFGDDLRGIWFKFLEDYDAIEGDVVGFCLKSEENRGIKVTTDMGLFYMKLFLEGYFRFTPVQRRLSKKDSVPMDLGFDYTNNNEGSDMSNLVYEYKGQKFETPLFGVYAPMVMDYLFGEEVDLGGGRVLQKRQIDAIMTLGKVNFIAAPRGGGKSWVATLIAGLCIMKEPVGSEEKLKPILVNYFGETDEGNEEVVNYILRLSDKFKDSGMFERKSSKNTLEFHDGDTVRGRVRFKSNFGKTKGKGGRPTITIIDEASRIDEIIYKTAFSNAIRDNTQIIAISTIDPTTDKNRFYQELISAENDQFMYEDINDAVVRIRQKYGFHKKKSKEEFTQEELIAAKKELRSTRLFIGLRYTFDDIEFLTAEEKKEKMRLASKMDPKFILAEFRSIFADKTNLFELKGNIENEMPRLFDKLALGFDPATDYDNPALCLTGLLGGIVYIINSRVLDKDSERQYQQILQVLGEADRYFPADMEQKDRIIMTAVDLTYGGEYILSGLTLRGIPVDLPVKTTSSKQSDMRKEGRYIHIPKKMMIDVTKDYFQKGYLKVNADLGFKGGIIDEITFYQPHMSGGRMKTQGMNGHKDDQVSAMMVSIFCFYEELAVIHAEIETEHITEKPKSLEEFIAQQESMKAESSQFNKHNVYVALCN